jgi:hypothetical protein
VTDVGPYLEINVISACLAGYKDNDLDGYGAGAYGCYAAGSYNVVSNNTDCNDSDSFSNVLRPLYSDSDGDGCFGTFTGSACVTAAQSAASIASYNACSDCADNNPAVTIWRSGYYDKDGDGYFGTYSPTICMAASQVSASSNDCNDSNGSVWNTANGAYIDSDGDGYVNGQIYGLCYGNSLPAGYTWSNPGIDCNDSNAYVYQNLSVGTDADNDGYIAEGSSASACVGSCDGTYRCKNTSGSYTKRVAAYTSGYNDCLDTLAVVWRLLNVYSDNDGDGYGAGTLYMSQCVGNPSWWSSNNSDCNDSNTSLNILRTLWTDADGDGYYGTVTGSACITAAQSAASITAYNNYPDCADNNPDVTIWRAGYYDADGDGYAGSYSPTICMAASQVADHSSDCYDSNYNAHPGQTAYFTTNRGDGSFDYDCSGAATTAGAWDRYVSGSLGSVASMKDNVGVCGSSNGGSTCLVLSTGAGGCGKANYGTWGALSYYAQAGCAGSAYAQDNYHCGYPIGSTISCH